MFAHFFGAGRDGLREWGRVWISVQGLKPRGGARYDGTSELVPFRETKIRSCVS
jgi:hypothetical protein